MTTAREEALAALGRLGLRPAEWARYRDGVLPWPEDLGMGMAIIADALTQEGVEARPGDGLLILHQIISAYSRRG